MVLSCVDYCGGAEVHRLKNPEAAQRAVDCVSTLQPIAMTPEKNSSPNQFALLTQRRFALFSGHSFLAPATTTSSSLR
jgi:hypothetical protein